MLPVLCEASLIGHESRPVTAATCLLLVDVDGAPVAAAVPEPRAPMPEELVAG